MGLSVQNSSQIHGLLIYFHTIKYKRAEYCTELLPAHALQEFLKGWGDPIINITKQQLDYCRVEGGGGVY